MLDKIVILDKKAVLVYTNRPAVTLYSDTDIVAFVLWFFSRTAGLTPTQFSTTSEDTCDITLNAA